MDLPLALHLLDMNSLRLKVDPLSPATALSKGAGTHETVQQDSRLPDLTAGCLLERHLPCPFEPIQPIQLTQIILTNAFRRKLAHLSEKLDRRK